MKDQKMFKLIDGVFSTQEGKDIVTNVFSSKIQFHQVKNFSTQERFGKDDQTSIKRIPELQKSLEEILLLINAAETKDSKLEIRADLVLNIVEA